MIDQHLAPDDIVRRGKEIYENSLRTQLEPQENGKYVVIDVDSGAFEVDQELIKAVQRLEAKKSQSQVFVGRIGYPTAIKLGGAFSATAR